MEKILLNLALIDLNNFCRENPSLVNCGTAGTQVVKNGRGFRYTLVTADTRREIVSVLFHKKAVPTHFLPA